MSEERKVVRLGDLGRIVTGKTPSTKVPENFGEDVPFVTPSDMDGRKTINETERYLSTSGVGTVKNAMLPAGAVIVSCIGSDMGKSAIAGRECVTNQQINSIIVSDEWCAEYVYYDLSTRKAELQNLASGGSAQPILNKGHFSQMPIVMPPLDEQRAIASILGSLDDKIELNRRTNETLEEMARALFKSWFVDFDPVRAKIEGCQPAGMDDETAALFPDSLEGLPLGEIPKGWSVESLDKIAHFLNGLALQKYPPEGDEFLPAIKIAELRKGVTASSGRASTKIPPQYVVEDGDVLFSWSGSLEVQLWTGGRGALNQHLFKVTSKRYPKWFYYYWIKQHLPEFRAIAADKATTMGHIKRHHLTDALTVVPPEPMLQTMNATMEPIVSKMLNNDLESRTLAAIRDALLPKLLSGEIRVRQAEEVVEETA